MSQITYKTKRVASGLLTMIAVLVIFDLIPGPFRADISPGAFFYFSLWSSIWSLFEVGLAAFAGAYVARMNFAGPAAVLSVLLSLLVVSMLQFIAAPVEHVLYSEILSRNAIGFALSVAGAVVGAEIGRCFYARRIKAISSAV